MHLTVSSVWVIYEIIVLIWTEFLSRKLALWEKLLLVLIGIGVAVYGGYSEHQDSVAMSSLTQTVHRDSKTMSAMKKTVTDTQAQLNDARGQLATISKGQEFNKGQLDIIGKIDAQTLKLLASKTDTSPDAGANAVANAAASKIEQLSQQVAILQEHTMTPVIQPDVEAQIIASLRAAGPHPVYVNELAGNKNAVDYGGEWLKIFKTAGWMKATDGPNSFMPFGSVPVGLSFQIKGPQIPEGLHIFGRILKDKNIPYDGKATPAPPTVDENAFVLVVGANP